MVVSSLHLVNTRTVLVVMGTVTVYNMIIAKTFFRTAFLRELFEAAELDGCGLENSFSKSRFPVQKRLLR